MNTTPDKEALSAAQEICNVGPPLGRDHAAEIIMHHYAPVRQLAEIAAALPLSSNRTREEARKLLGLVLHHKDIHGSHGCVDVMNAVRVIDALIGERNQWQECAAKLAVACEKLLTAGEKTCELSGRSTASLARLSASGEDQATAVNSKSS